MLKGEVCFRRKEVSRAVKVDVKASSARTQSHVMVVRLNDDIHLTFGGVSYPRCLERRHAAALTPSGPMTSIETGILSLPNEVYEGSP